MGTAGTASFVAGAGAEAAGATGAVAGSGGELAGEGGDGPLDCGPHLICESGSCIEGFADCNGTLDDGCEIAIGIDDAHCGRCGNSCLPAGSCSNGTCVFLGEGGQAGAGGAPAEARSRTRN